MSGRLIITGKKTYCPWRPENVERVLRDERLERERLQREEEANSTARIETLKRRRRRADENGNGANVRAGGGGGGECDDSAGGLDGHVHLFAREEKEAAQRAVEGALLGGQSHRREAKDRSSSASFSGGVAPVFLGGDEARRRKAGVEPFYLCSSSSAAKAEAAAKASGEASGRTALEESSVSSVVGRKDAKLKGCMDPMRYFFSTNPSSAVVGEPARNIAATAATAPIAAGTSNGPIEVLSKDSGAEKGGSKRSRSCRGNRKKRRPERRDRRRIRTRHRHGNEADESSDEASFTASSSSSSSTDCSSESENSSSREKRRTRRQSKKCQRRDRSRRRSQQRTKMDDRYDPDGCRRSSKSKHLPNEGNAPSNGGNSSGGVSMEDLRRRRTEREEREAAREADLIRTEERGGRGTNSHHHRDRDRRYHDQYNPNLSRR